MQHQKQLNIRASFPRDKYPEIRENQDAVFEFIEKHPDEINILELPTGTGKTAVGYAYLKARMKVSDGSLIYVAPTKALVDQVSKMHPDFTVAYGRHEYNCLYYPDEKPTPKADEIPCLQLMDCPHRVDQEIGETVEPGVIPCPYYAAKFRARRSRLVVCTAAFYFFAQWYQRLWEKPAGVVVDEAHNIARAVRQCLSFDITDYNLSRSIALLKEIGAEEADVLKRFLNRMIYLVKRKPPHRPILLEDGEVERLLAILQEIDPKALTEKVGLAVKEGRIDPKKDRETLLKLVGIVRNLRNYVRQLEFSLPTESRNPLNYVYAFYREELLPSERVQYRLVVQAFYVAPVIQRILPRRYTLAYSATIGDPEIFGYDTGIRGNFLPLPSPFPVENTRVFLPIDTPNLAKKERSRQEPTKVLRRIAKACRRFAKKGFHSLVVVESNLEQDKFLLLCDEEGVKAVSYGNGVAAREAVARFKQGEGDVLVGTAANYGEGIDLPKQLAPVIFFLRPGYPSPEDPGTKFQERRFRKMFWPLTNWRVMLEALQVRGRNVRSEEDLGVAFFISQQFRRFLFAALPEWLQKAYRGDKSFDECVKETEKLLES